MNTQNLENVMTGFKRLAAMLAVVIALTLTGCSNSPSSGLTSYTDSYDGYRFLYPNEWIEMDASNLAPDVVLHDLIERSENLSVIINPAQAEETLTDLGTPTEVGYELSKRAIAPEGSDRVAELVDAQSRQDEDGKTYYILEYAVTLPDQLRHNIASIAISRGQLFTLNVSTTERRWQEIQDKLRIVARSFFVY
ncbi:photosystem II reaction center PsbP family protein [Phormidium yuhuli AB48]|uniref:Photosystem II reaction center PsbP family protein n=1 Tax=Phormidium yuhuli AB48 TaxID=2940671 RepID=A0ABY5AQQ8_9CYAN|nr:photosystem II reaction center PsbP [Phormidium yuhuli]USR91562.1 photosystem II reaction center PsbP family protein [Phormidium yuhuli AB48]